MTRTIDPSGGTPPHVQTTFEQLRSRMEGLDDETNAPTSARAPLWIDLDTAGRPGAPAFNPGLFDKPATCLRLDARAGDLAGRSVKVFARLPTLTSLRATPSGQHGVTTAATLAARLSGAVAIDARSRVYVVRPVRDPRGHRVVDVAAQVRGDLPGGARAIAPSSPDFQAPTPSRAAAAGAS